MTTLTKLVVGMSRFGDHLLGRKVSGIVVAALAFACGACLAYALGREPRTPGAARTTPPADPARAEVSVRDTFEPGTGDAAADRGRCPKR
jgi:hypothetical protein